MARPARRLTEWKTCSGPTRSSSSTGGTASTTIRRLAGRRDPFREVALMAPLSRRASALRKHRVRVGAYRRIRVGNRRLGLSYDARMTRYRWLPILGTLIPTLLAAQTGPEKERGPYARIAFLRPHDGDTVDFEAGYIRHLEFHRQAGDTWTWYGWTIWAGERQRWLVYATFGHTAASLDRPVSPADDERDNVANVTPHAEF